MGEDFCKFNLLLVAAGSACIDSIGMMIYTKCPNFKLHIAGTLADAVNQTKLHAPDVFIIDEEMRKVAGFRYFEESLERNKSVVFYLVGSDTVARSVMEPATPLTLRKTISADDLQRKMVTVAEELFWRKMSSAGTVMPRLACEREEEQ